MPAAGYDALPRVPANHQPLTPLLFLERAAQVGCVLAAYVVETVGTQEYDFTSAQFVDRLRASYGDEAADEVGAFVR